MASATFEYVRPISGGGLGDCKIGIIEFTGDYVVGGFNVGLGGNVPLFAVANNGCGVSFANGKMKFTSPGGGTGGSVVIPAQTVTGVTATVGDIAVSSATIVEDTYPGETITGVTASVGGITVPSQTVAVTGEGGEGGELSAGTVITGMKVMVVVKGGY